MYTCLRYRSVGFPSTRHVFNMFTLVAKLFSNSFSICKKVNKSSVLGCWLPLTMSQHVSSGVSRFQIQSCVEDAGTIHIHRVIPEDSVSRSESNRRLVNKRLKRSVDVSAVPTDWSGASDCMLRLSLTSSLPLTSGVPVSEVSFLDTHILYPSSIDAQSLVFSR